MANSQDLRSQPGSSNPFIQGLLGYQAFQPGYVITVVFQAEAGDSGTYGGARWAAKGAKDAFMNAVAAWTAVANISVAISSNNYHAGQDRSNYTWVETLADLGTDNGSTVLGRHHLPQTGDLVGTFNDVYPGFTINSTKIGGFNFSIFIHEIGHGLGLTHPHDGGPAQFPGVSDAYDLGDNQLNTMLTTVMTYNNDRIGSITPPSKDWGWAATPMAFDIAAIQLIYGANMSYHTGNDTYILPTSAAPGTFWQCIWDAGGTDTISAFGAFSGTTIDLRAASLLDEVGGGGWMSRVGSISGGFTIANGVTIENAIGSSLNDSITGNEAANNLQGNGGDDQIFGRGGNDTLQGSYGNDHIEGGAGDDFLYGGDGDDDLDGGDGSDYMDGGEGWDTLRGGAGNDHLLSGNGYGTLVGGDGDDVLTAGDGSNNLDGGAGNDILTAGFGTSRTLDGGDGDDVIVAGGGGSLILGGNGNDGLTGGSGNDTLNGGTGDDLMTGGFGNDTYYIDSISDQAIEQLGQGVDTIYVNRDFALSDAFENLNLTDDGKLGIGTNGDNILTATNVDAYLHGLQGNDTIKGPGHLYGDDGNDTLSATGSPSSYLDGGSGNDTIHGAWGADTLVGDVGNDLLDGGLGADQINGGDGDDELYGDIRVDFTNYDPYAGASMPTGPIGIGETDNAIDTLSGGAGNDKIYLVGASYLNGSFTNSGLGLAPIHYTSADIIDGGAGFDTVEVASEVDFQGTFTSIERLNFRHLTYPSQSQYNALGQPGVLILKGNQLSQIQAGTTFAGTGTVQLDLNANASFSGANWNFESGAEMVVKINGGAGANALSGTSHGTGSVEFDLDTGGSFSALGWNFDSNAQTVIKINGGSGDNILTGTSHADQISGGAGNDRLIGGLGNDVLNGGAGDDMLIVAGRDQATGGDGTDTLVLADRASSYRLLQQNGQLWLAGQHDGVAIATVERLQFSDRMVAASDLAATVKGFNALAYIASYSDLIKVYGTDADGGARHFIQDGFKEGRHTSFDPLAYIASYSDLIAVYGTDADGGARHFIQDGFKEGRHTSFDPLAYISSYSDLIKVYGTDADGGARHFIQDGFKEGRHTSFDPLAYIASYSDLIAVYGTDADGGARHFIQDGFKEGRYTSFDPLAYIASYSDLIKVYGTDADGGARHFIQDGFKEGRHTSFDPLAYIASYSDLIAVYGTDADGGARHFIQDGFREGRHTSFDPLAYGASYLDLARVFGDDAAALTRHYINYGHAEGRSPDAGFDAVAYLLSYVDLQAANLGSEVALHHWLKHGVSEGRVGDAWFGREQVGHDLQDGLHTNGSIDGTGDRDWYLIHASAGKTIDLHFDSQAADADLELHYSHGGLVASAAVNHGGSGSDLIYTVQQADDYYLVVRPHSAGDIGAYGMDLHIV